MKQRVFCLTVLMLVFSVVSAWGAVSEIFVLGDTSTPPPGYTYTGMTMYSSDKWTAKGKMPTARKKFAVVTANNKIYAIGGSDKAYVHPIAKNEEYDPVTNTWTVKANMPTARSELAAVTVNGKIYAIGGCNANGGWFCDSFLHKNEEYDPVTNIWSVKANMPTARGGLALAVVNGKIYAIGGLDLDGHRGVNEEYDPSTDTWAVKAKMRTAREYLAAAAVNGKIYAIGGYIDDGYYPGDTNEIYNPSTNTWTVKANMPTARGDLAVAEVNGKIYAIGGTVSDDQGYWYAVGASEEYNPAANTWVVKTNMPTARSGLAAAGVNGTIYALGGTLYDVDFDDPVRVNMKYSPPIWFYIHKQN